MRSINVAVALASALILSACTGGLPVSRTSGGSAVGLVAISEAQPNAAVLAPKYNVQQVRVTVPQELQVSEANAYYPIADIVWRGEAHGDRHAQVRQIFTEAIGFGTSGMKSGPAVIVEAEIVRFHALTEKTRFTFGGVHSLRFNLTVRDAATGAVIDGPRFVIADIKASGGKKALVEDQAGRTQRVVIIENLSQVIRRELSRQVAAPELPPVSRIKADPTTISAQEATKAVQLSL